MSGVDPAALPYRSGVGVMLLNRDGRVWVGERHDRPGAWQMPQGGIDSGEAPRAAAMRELEEETGARNVEVLAEKGDWLAYDLPPELVARVWGGRYRGQRQKWFACRFLGEDGEIELGASGHGEFSAWRWVGIVELPRLVVPFKRALYETVLEEFRHLCRPVD